MTVVPKSTAVRLVQVSDTHLSRERGHFNPNFAVFCRLMQANPPDLIVNSGDLSLNGAGVEDDLVFAKAWHDKLPAPWVAIPGNHDIGEAPPFSRLEQPLTAERMQRFERLVGPRWWQREIGGWQLIGLDSSLMGSELPDERRQMAFLRDALASTAGTRKLVFVHMPPYERDPADPKFTTHSVPFPARGALLDACVAGGVRAIACAHLHVHRALSYRGMQIVWAPTTAFVNIARHIASGYGFPRAGYIEWTLAGDAVTYRLVEPHQMITQDVGRWNDEVGSTITMPPLDPPWPG
ncbi:MAG: metallophosphoesterase family protein [Hyphomicrobiaceae bacterium]